MRLLFRRGWYLLRRRQLEADLADEMEFHRALKQQHLEERGAAPVEADFAARRALGNATLAMEDARAVWIRPWFESAWQDIAYAFRQMRREPGVTLIIVGVLTLAIGANTAIFSAVDSVLIKPLRYPDPDRLVNIRETNLDNPGSGMAVSVENFLDWKDRVPAFDAVAGWQFDYLNVSGVDEPEQAQGLRISASYLPLLGARTTSGRLFLPEDEQPGREQSVILTEALWRRRFGSAPDLVGHVITIEGHPVTVVGILSGAFPVVRILNRAIDLYVPIRFDVMPMGRRNHNLNVYARLRGGVALDRAQAQLDQRYRELAETYPASNATLGARLISMPDAATRGSRPVLLLLMGAVATVLLIACANIAGVMLARGSVRRREMAVRAALGAGRGRLVRQALTESVLLALIGGVWGTLAAIWSVRLLNRFFPYSIVSRPFELDATVLGFSFVISLLCGLLFGMIPAARTGRWSLAAALAHAGRVSLGRDAMRGLGRLLVTVQLALTLALTAGALLLIRSAVLLDTMPRGLDLGHVLTMQIWLPTASYREGDQASRFYERVLDRVAQLPGVESASVVNFPPLAPQSTGVSFDVGDRPPASGTAPLFARYSVIDPRYFHTMRIPVLAGRTFADSDGDEARGVVVISASIARRLWPNANPLGRQIHPHFPRQRNFWDAQSQNLPLTIVGVVGDVREDGPNLGERDPEMLYLPYRQNPAWLMHLVIRTQSNPLASANAVRQAVWSVDRNQPVFDIKSMDSLAAETFVEPRLVGSLTASLSIVAILLAAVGVYGLSSYLVTQRTAEIGVRVALGAEPRHILRGVLGEGAALGLAGIGTGLVIAFGTTRLASRFLFGVRANDPATFAAVAVLLLSVTLVACLIPARRAMRTQPMVALRTE